MCAVPQMALGCIEITTKARLEAVSKSPRRHDWRLYRNHHEGTTRGCIEITTKARLEAVSKSPRRHDWRLRRNRRRLRAIVGCIDKHDSYYYCAALFSSLSKAGLNAGLSSPLSNAAKPLGGGLEGSTLASKSRISTPPLSLASSRGSARLLVPIGVAGISCEAAGAAAAPSTIKRG
jgi:hypothetical protein